MSARDPLFADIGALIFDCDGTLVDTAALYHHCYDLALRTFGMSMPIEWYLQRAGKSEDALLDEFENCVGLAIERDRCIRKMRNIFLNSLSELKEIEPVTSIARAFERRIPLAVASGGPKIIVTATLHATKLASLFDAVVTVEDVGKPKPAPDLFLEAARRIQIAPDRCLVFEDSKEGLEAAERAGMKACDVRSLF